MKRIVRLIITGIFLFVPSLLLAAAPVTEKVNLDLFATPIQFSDGVSMLLSLSLVSLVPFFVVTTTSFLRFIIVFSTMRMAMGTQQSPPNMVLIGIAIFMTIFVMSDVWMEIDHDALQPYRQGKITQNEMLAIGSTSLKAFMLKHVREDDLALFVEFSKIKVDSVEELPIWVVIPAFIMSEITAAFSVAFVIFIPFVLVDLIVANVLLSLGMFMLSPVMVSLPFKILLFVLADGFTLITRGLLLSFQ